MIKLNTNMLLTVLIGTMVLVSAMQTLQLVSLTSALSSGRIAVGTGAAVASAPLVSSGAAASGSLANLPSMVGGC
ncbi:MAG: hypothetical protein HY361_03370 [Candidatus Aenigmarchaeota archaeon]|nr:hypothetical protein [Candidatus Aenigmarchaeota archaeon]